VPSALRRSDQPLAHASSKGGGECSVAFSCTCSCGNLWHWSAKKSGSSRRSGVCRAVEVSSGAFSTPGSAEVDAAKCRCHAADCCFVALQRLESFVAGGMHEGGRRGALGGIATLKGARGDGLESSGLLVDSCCTMAMVWYLNVNSMPRARHAPSRQRSQSNE